MRIGLIGCGKVGTTLFSLLKKNNQIVGVYDTNKKNQKRALNLMRINENLPLKQLCARSEALFFATPDDEISKAFEKIRPLINHKKYIFHFSGLLPARIFKKSENCYYAALHPFATFPRISIPPARKKYFLFVTGDFQAVKAAEKIFSRKNFTLRKLNKKNKDIYHLIGVFSSNLLVGLISSIHKLSKKINWHDKDFYEMTFPLIQETVDNIKNYKIRNALSGPLERGDIKVIKKHLRTLTKDKDLLSIYKVLSLAILHNVTKCKNRKKVEELLKN